MAHYALLDSKFKVVQIFVGKDENDLVDGVSDWEEYYAPKGMTVKRTSYNTYGGEHANGGTPFRKNYASIGFSYDPVRDAFIPPRPTGDQKWVLNEDTCLWEEVTDEAV